MDPDERPNSRDVAIYATLPNELPRALNQPRGRVGIAVGTIAYAYLHRQWSLHDSGVCRRFPSLPVVPRSGASQGYALDVSLSLKAAMAGTGRSAAAQGRY